MSRQFHENLTTAKIIADSISPSGVRLTTFEVEFPRIILAELNTHKMVSKNGSSTRAIPLKTQIDRIRNQPFTPNFWGINKSGMSADEQFEGEELVEAKKIWNSLVERCIESTEILDGKKFHKQIAGRFLEPVMMQKMVLTATDWNNFFWLRNHDAAQPEFHYLADKMYQEFIKSIPVELDYGQWHLPYVVTEFDHGVQTFFDQYGNLIDLETAKKISMSCCAQTSYRKQDGTVEKADDIMGKLNLNNPIRTENRSHSSPAEHQGTPIQHWYQDGVTHLKRKKTDVSDSFCVPYSANFRGWVQLRQTLANHDYPED